MARQQPIELFMPPNMLKAKAGGGQGGVDMAALRRADAAMETLGSQFGAMMESDVDALVLARTRFATAQDDAARNALLRAALDLKGNAPTFHFPLIGRVAGALSRLIGEVPGALPAALVEAHVSAVQVIHRQNIRSADDRMAQTLCAELEARVNELMPKKAK